MKSSSFSPGLLILLVTFISLTIEANNNEGSPIQMTVGSYEALSVTKGFDTQTGEPVYYVVAMYLKPDVIVDSDTKEQIPIELHQPVKFYKVSRSLVKNLVPDTKADTSFHFHGRLQVG